MDKRICLAVIFTGLFSSFLAFAQKTVKVTAQYTYIAPDNVTLEQAKLVALDRAKIQAISDEFGTVVTQNNTTVISNNNGESNIDFMSIGGSDIKGEWIETFGTPKYSIGYEQNQLVVNVVVRGKIREIKTKKIDFIAQVLCNGTTSQHERNEFKNGDDLYLKFQSPVDGYLVVYLVDYGADKAFCLLPYRQSIDASQEIEENKTHTFFSIDSAPIELRDYVDEYSLTCTGDYERNDVVVIFSPNKFVKANSVQGINDSPRELRVRDNVG